MINRLHVENFKCLLDIDVDLGPFTVLIGPNDSGKSSILDAIALLGQTMKAQDPDRVLILDPLPGQTRKVQLDKVFAGAKSLDNLIWQREVNRNIVWKVAGRSADQSIHYLLELSPALGGVAHESLSVEQSEIFAYQRDGSNSISVGLPTKSAVRLETQIEVRQTALAQYGQHPHLMPPPGIKDFIESLSSVRKYRLEPEALRNGSSPNKPHAIHPDQSPLILSASGDNLAAVLDGILTSADRSLIMGLEEVLHQEIPTLQTVSTRPNPQNHTKSLQFGLANTRPIVSIPAELVSDGAILLTAFLAMAYGETPEIIFIEEPENGLHYSRFKLVIEHFRKMSTGEIGNRPRQVIITTHSPVLLNFCRPEEVRVCLRDRDKGTTITAMAEVPNIKTLLQEFATGELWYLLGEEKLFKEQPA